MEYWRNPIGWNAQAHAFRLKHGRRQRVFCASLADVFDNQVDPTWRSDLFGLIRDCDQLDWQLLTKRPQNMHKMLPPDWNDGYPNVWLGTTAEDANAYEARVPHLLDVPATIHFVSYEPAIGPLNSLDIGGLFPDWLIIGGENGVRSDLLRRTEPQWARDALSECGRLGIAAFLKQWGTYDIFCGPGRSRVRETGKFIDGSPIAAFKKGQGSPGPFTSVYVSDADDELLSSCEKRLQNLDAPVRAVKGPASEAMPAIVQQLNPAGFTLRIP